MKETELKPCPECVKVVKLRDKKPSVFHAWNPLKHHPKWYQNGKQCPLCGAGYESEFTESAGGLFNE